jgi:hypothetical protein
LIEMGAQPPSWTRASYALSAKQAPRVDKFGGLWVQAG